MSASDKQVGGDHYTYFKIQPGYFSTINRLGFLEGDVVKRICRHGKPSGKGAQDLVKIIHEVCLLLEWEYGVEMDFEDPLP